MYVKPIEVSSDNLASLHCSCLHACLAAYSSILRRDLNTASLLSAVYDVTAVDQSAGGLMSLEAFEASLQ